MKLIDWVAQLAKRVAKIEGRLLLLEIDAKANAIERTMPPFRKSVRPEEDDFS